MPRLFVAIDIPDALKDKLATLKTDIPSAKWVKPMHMHLTIRFIGPDVPEDQLEPIKSALATIQASAFDLTLSTVGRFPPSEKKAPRVLWVGTVEQPALLTLKKQVDATLESIGYTPEDRFNAHITLARLRAHKPTPEANAFLQDQATFQAGTFTVRRFILYNSTLTPQGPRYTHEAVYPLQES